MAGVSEAVIFDYQELFANLHPNPYPFYKKLLEINKPVIARDVSNDYKDVYLLSHYDDVTRFLSFKDDVSGVPDYFPEQEKSYPDYFIMNLDGQEHLAMRKILSSFFSKQQMHSITEYISRYLSELIKRINQLEEIDLIKHVASDFSLAVLARIMGADDVIELEGIRKSTIDLMTQGDSLLHKNGFYSSNIENHPIQDLANFSHNLVNRKRKKLSDDLTSHIISACKDSEICDIKIVANVIFILIAGHDTTVNMAGNGLFLLLNHPSQLKLLASDYNLANSATEEIVRFESPIQRTSYRVTKSEVVLSNYVIPKDRQVMLFLGAANRDPKVFSESNVFDITRKNNPHIAYGHGLHNCIGRSLAKIEGNSLFPPMARYLKTKKLKNTTPIWRRNSLTRGLDSLVVVNAT